MDTLVKSTGSVKSGRKSIISDKFWQQAEENRFGIIVALLLIIGCTGGIAAAFGAESDTLQIVATVFPTILSLASILGLAPMRLILSLSTIAVFFDILVLLF